LLDLVESIDPSILSQIEIKIHQLDYLKYIKC
jgi:hypothetical protein